MSAGAAARAGRSAKAEGANEVVAPADRDPDHDVLGEGGLRGIREVTVPSRIDGGPGGKYLAGEPDAGSRLRAQLVRRHVAHRRCPDDVACGVDQPDRAVVRADQLAGDVEQAREQRNEVGFAPHRIDEDLEALELAREAGRSMETGGPGVVGG